LVSASPTRVRIGAFELDLKAGELCSPDGKVRRLQEQPFQILRMLVQRAGDVVTRDEIQKLLWPNDTVVEFDHSIHTAINKLRQAFGDSAEAPKYIETVARRGYRLVVPVDSLNPIPNPIANPTPAGRVNDEPVHDDSRPPTSSSDLRGKQISHYRVLDVLGVGGMGVVYKAEDVKLGRRVALKFLPEGLARDEKALDRFEREARAASALDHPNICTIHELGEYDGHPFIAMSLLEGQTLRDRIAARGTSFRTSELLNLSIQIADGLAAAHEKGIIHRDIKPANIFITNKDEAKILDFGLAKLADAGDHEALHEKRTAASPLDLSLSLTDVALGTVPYMSPEQVRGEKLEKLDARTDLFSLGVVIYEMATGQQAFQADTTAQLHEAILTGTPIPPRQLNPALPPKLEEIIHKSLEKDREVRCQSASEIRADLKRLKRDTESGSTPPSAQAQLPAAPRQTNRKFLLGAAAALLLLFVFLGLRWFFTNHSSTKQRLSERRITHNTPDNRVLGEAISPDGKYLAYVDTNGLHLNVIDTGEVHDIALPQEVQGGLWDVTWFPDSQTVLLNGTSKDEGFVLWATSVFGGTPHKLRTFARFAAVSPQGSIAFVSRGPEIWVMGSNGENPRKVLTSETERFTAVAWSPGGGRLAYIKRSPVSSQPGGSIETVPVEGGKPSSVISSPRLNSNSAGGLQWLRDGRIIFSQRERDDSDDANLWTIAVDPRTGKSTGEPTRTSSWYGFGAWIPTASADGRRMAVIKARMWDDVYVGELKDDGSRLDTPKRLTVSDSQDFVNAWTRDSKEVFFSSDRAGKFQIFKQQLGDTAAQTVIQGQDDVLSATLSPDGSWLLYWTRPHVGHPKTMRLMRARISGGEAEQILEEPVRAAVNLDCPSHADALCVFSRHEKDSEVFYALDPQQGLGKQLTSVHGPAGEWGISPDGTRIAVDTTENIRLIDFRTGAQRYFPSTGGVWSLVWTPDGKALIVTLQRGEYLIARIDLDGKTRILLNRGRNQWIGNASVSPDGRYLAFSQQSWDTNAWLLENF
jgi:serine/threonine protein kinase/Tol biopolymer transport system component